MGMRVPNVADVVDAVQVLFPELIVHVLALGPDEFDRVGPVEELATPADILLTEAECFRERDLLGGGDHRSAMRMFRHRIEFESWEENSSMSSSSSSKNKITFSHISPNLGHTNLSARES